MLNKIAFIGGGSMAEAVIAGIINTAFLDKDQIFVTNKENKERLDYLQNTYGVQCSNDKHATLSDAEVVVVATKPYDVEKALQDAAPYIQGNQLVISVVAGVPTDFITTIIDKNVAVVRSMPNTSATIGFSATAITKGRFATDADIQTAHQLFAAIGTVSEVEESEMHAVTGLSGSGPAYIYYIVEAMENAAKKEGLDTDTAKQLIAQTIIGAGNMLQKRSESAAQLRENVTSPNGTTAAGLDTLADYNILEAFEKCVETAADRSRELGNES